MSFDIDTTKYMAKLRDRLGVRTTIDPKLNAGAWALYDGMEGVETAAEMMTCRFKMLVNSGASRKLVREGMSPVFAAFSKFGAEDSAVRETFEYMLDAIYGEQ